MPESPLFAELSSDDRVFWTAVTTGAGVILVGLLGIPRKGPAKATNG